MAILAVIGIPGIMCFLQRLSEYVVSVGSLCGQLSEEYQLQYSGWCTALANCDSIVRYVCVCVCNGTYSFMAFSTLLYSGKLLRGENFHRLLS